jgi:hypothetical protein
LHGAKIAQKQCGWKAQQPSVPAQAKVVVYRPNLAGARGGVNVLHSEPKVFIDDVQVGKMPRASVKRGSVLEFSVAPGTHHIYSDEKSRGASFEASAGQIYYVRITLLVGGFTVRGEAELVDAEQGEYESREARNKQTFVMNHEKVRATPRNSN